jgi:hypothetical protein
MASETLELILKARKQGQGPAQVAKELKDFQKEAKKSADALAPLHSAAKKAGLALAALGAAGFAFIGSATKLAARVETLGVVTTRLGANVGKTENEIRALEQSIVDQGITLQKSRAAVARMIQAQIDLKNSTTLARIAQDAAVIANLNSSDAFEHLINTIVTGNVRMGRTIGLQLQFGKAQQVLAKELGKTVEELNQQEVIQARTNEVLKAATTISGAYASAMETAGKQLLSLDRHIEESRRIIGEQYLGVFSGLILAVTDALKAFQGLDSVQQAQISVGIGYTATIAAISGAILLAIPAIAALKVALVSLGIAISGATLGIGAIVAVVAALGGVLVAQAAAARQAKKDSQALAKEFIGGRQTYEDYVEAIEAYSEETGEAIKKTETVTITQRGYSAEVEKTTGSVELLTEAQFNWALEAQSADAVMLRTGETMALITRDPLFKLKESIRENTQRTSIWSSLVAEAEGPLLGVASAAGIAGSSIDTNLTGSIGTFLEQMEFFIGGGFELQQEFLKVQQAVAEGKITPEQGRDFAEGLFVAAQDLQVDLGNISAFEAGVNIKEQLGGSLDEAREKLANIDEDLDALGRTIDITIRIATEGLQGDGLLGFQSGGVVPGMMGMPQLAVVHGGETVTPPSTTNNIMTGSTFNFAGREGDDEFLSKMRRAVRRL